MFDWIFYLFGWFGVCVFVQMTNIEERIDALLYDLMPYEAYRVSFHVRTLLLLPWVAGYWIWKKYERFMEGIL